MILSYAAAVGRFHPQVARSSSGAAGIAQALRVAPAFITRLAPPALAWRISFVTRANAGGREGPSSSQEEESDDPDDNEEPFKRPRASKWMIVGLGNPGSKFVGTRHNVGFEAIDLLALQENIKLNTIQCKALVGKGMIEGVPVLLVKPQTYMNLSGDAVSPLALYYRVKPDNILVIHDDMDLDVAAMKMVPKGGPGGHNGMRNIIERFKDNKNIPRLRIGIGRPPGAMDPKAYVLQKFTQREKVEIDVCYERGADAVRLIMSDGFVAAVSKWRSPKRSRDPTASPAATAQQRAKQE
ncbi:peptidyl-tRNA hydrolase, mitochondrial [Selaginella moellendorffii]|nr:peptidyl-tRNA hydrolase, mitochondrial [Selaginella moellendorffii]|eukprot:XP_002965044.2 peptidyl-tRNA hydrolase, mitochondrial [Selaginella moellendorffii]